MYVFANGGEREVFIGSADWMGRNLDRRVETVVPVLDPLLSETISVDILDVVLADNVKSRILRSDGTYERRGVLPGGVPGVNPGRAVVIGGGVSGWNATQIAVGLGFHVTLLDKDVNKLREADKIFGNRVRTITSNAFELERAVLEVCRAATTEGARHTSLGRLGPRAPALVD